MGRAWPWLESWRRRWHPGAGVTPLLAARLEGIRAALVSVCHGHLPRTNQDILISRGWSPKEVHPTSGTGSLLASLLIGWLQPQGDGSWTAASSLHISCLLASSPFSQSERDGSTRCPPLSCFPPGGSGTLPTFRDHLLGPSCYLI